MNDKDCHAVSAYYSAFYTSGMFLQCESMCAVFFMAAVNVCFMCLVKSDPIKGLVPALQHAPFTDAHVTVKL